MDTDKTIDNANAELLIRNSDEPTKLDILIAIVKMLVENGRIEKNKIQYYLYDQENCDVGDICLENNILTIVFWYTWDPYEKEKEFTINLSEVELINKDPCLYTLKSKKERTSCSFSTESFSNSDDIIKLEELFTQYKRLVKAELRAASKACPKVELTEITDSQNEFSKNDTVEVIRVDIPEVNGFEACKHLKKIIIGPRVNKIGQNAFKSCNQLNEIIFEEGGSLHTIEGFPLCSGLKKITIPASVEKISGFYNCTGLQKVSFTSDTKIKEISGFQFCSSLKEINLRYDLEGFSISPSNAAKIKRNFDGVTINDALVIQTSEDMDKLRDVYKSITIEDSVILDKLEITEPLFNLEFLYIGKGIKSLDSKSFSNCPRLKEVKISEDSEITEITGFNNNKNLSSINITKSIKNISGLNECPALKDVKINENCEFESISGFKESSSCFNLKIKTASKILQNGFTGLEQLTEVVVSKGVKEIGPSVFSDCVNLSKIGFENNSELEIIGDRAFYNCKELSCIVIPRSVKYITPGIFLECRNDLKIEFE